MNPILTLLIVEKDALEARHIQELLKKNTIIKVKSIVAPSLPKALEYLRKKTIDAIILDPKLPDSQGIESFRTINRAISNRPMIIIVGLKDEALALQAVKEGAQDFFLKGAFNGDMLVRSISDGMARAFPSLTNNEYAQIIKNSNLAIFSLTDKGIIKSWNPAAEAIYKYLAFEMIGQSILCLVSDSNQSEMLRLLTMIKSGVNGCNYEITLLDKNNNKIESLINGAPIENKMGDIIGVVIQAQDFTAYKKSEIQASLQLRVASIISESMNQHSATYGILKVLCEDLGFTEAELWATDSDIKALRYVSNFSSLNRSYELLQVSQGVSLHLNEGLPGYIWAQKRPYWTNTLDKEDISARKTLLTQWEINTCFGFPIVMDKEMYGVILLYGVNIHKFDSAFMIIFENIGKQIGNLFKRKRMEEELLYLAQHDALTGLANKFYTKNILDALIKQAKQHQTMVALLYFDLDHFKDINDLLGHHIGDLLLQEIARRVQKSIRDADLLARFGGDEFVVLLPGITKKEQIDIVAKKILGMVEQPFIFDKKEYYITASMGISIYPNNGDNIEKLFKSADSSMYRVKRAGRNSYKYANMEQDKAQQQELTLKTRLHHAIQNDEFVIYYQPIFDVQSDKIVSAEALIRWKTPAGKIIFPGEFIPQLEKTHLILKTGLWVLKAACSQMKKWETYSFHSISVNISVDQLNDHLVSSVKKILTETGLSPDKLILEITESMLMQQNYIMQDILSALRHLGVGVAIDDFGTGYSSFAYLKTFKIQILKIDRLFIEDLSESSKAIVVGIILMAHALGLKTIAEGVETKEQLEFLKENNCDMYQGYYSSKPLRPEELEKKFEHL